jgi:phosphatidylglycerol:prolipoprotein diacylglycerol transferase
VLAYFLHQFSPFIFEFREGVGLRWYGLAYVAAFLLGYLLYKRLAERGYTDLPPAQVADFITWAAVFGVMLGGRIGWILFYGLRQDHTGEPWWWPLAVWEGGMSSHGGIIGLVLFTLYWSRRHHLSWTSIGDCLVVVAPIGLGLVRLANFINGELFGKPAAVPWAMLFPKELYDEPALAEKLGLFGGDQIGAFIDAARHNPELADRLRAILTPRHPSQLYEAALEGVVLFLALWLLRTRCRVPRGVLTGAFFILYAMLRIIGEIFREPDRAWSAGPLSAGQFLSLFLILIGAAFIIWGLRTQQYERALNPAPVTAHS